MTLLLILLLPVAAAPVSAETRPAAAGIATQHPLATAVGEEILERGGNAFDAAVAISAALGVVEPYGSGAGGGGFWLLHLAEEQRDIFVDARETAPLQAYTGLYLDEDGKPVRDRILNGPLAAGIPGQPAGLVHLAERYATLPLQELLAPAIRLAREGVPVDEAIHRGLSFRKPVARRSSAMMEVFYPGGEPLEPGDTLYQPDLADTLERLARHGRAGFYEGETARLLVEGMRAAGGVWTHDDLRAYRVIEREPVRSRYRNLELVSAPPPSSGGIAMANMLNILAGFDLDRLDGATRKHVIIEAMRRAYRDRGVYLGDPDFVEIPVERLTDPDYAAGQRVSIRLDRATPSRHLSGVWPGSNDGTRTTHFSVLDREGNRVAGTLSINGWFGAGLMAPGTGVVLNNEMADFSLQPGVPDGFQLVGAEANAIEPGKRMLSSMSPTFLESDRGVAILGTPGGSRIITMVLLATLEWAAGGDPATMAALPRFHHQYYPDEVVYEPGAFTDDEKAALEALGHVLTPSSRAFGNMQIVTWERETGEVHTASDPRRAGEGVIY